MTDNIQKLYEIAGVPKTGCRDKKTGERCSYGSERWHKCNTHGLACPKSVWEKAEVRLTAEKQLEILKVIVHSFGFNSLDKPIWDKGWDIAIAKLVNIYWEVLSEKERKQIKEILQ